MKFCTQSTRTVIFETCVNAFSNETRISLDSLLNTEETQVRLFLNAMTKKEISSFLQEIDQFTPETKDEAEILHTLRVSFLERG